MGVRESEEHICRVVVVLVDVIVGDERGSATVPGGRTDRMYGLMNARWNN